LAEQPICLSPSLFRPESSITNLPVCGLASDLTSGFDKDESVLKSIRSFDSIEFPVKWFSRSSELDDFRFCNFYYGCGRWSEEADADCTDDPFTPFCWNF